MKIEDVKIITRVVNQRYSIGDIWYALDLAKDGVLEPTATHTMLCSDNLYHDPNDLESWVIQPLDLSSYYWTKSSFREVLAVAITTRPNIKITPIDGPLKQLEAPSKALERRERAIKALIGE